MRAELAAFGARADDTVVAGSVSWQWRLNHVLAPAHVDAESELVDLTEPGVRAALEDAHAELLAHYGMPHLDLSQITSKTRIVTQTISRSLFDNGASGIRFPSNTDSKPCIVLFEGRGSLIAAGAAEHLSTAIPELLAVCSEWTLVLRQSDLPTSAVQGGRGSALLDRLRRRFG